MSPAPTLADVAAAARVHKATASRALNPATRDMVSQETARRVQAAARRLGYVPNTLARGLRTARTSTVGVVLPDLTNPLFPPIVRGIEDVLARHGHVALLANTDNDDQSERAHIEALRGRRVDGFIVATARREHPLLDAMSADGVPLVLVNRTTDRRDISCVLGDDAHGIAAVLDHLVELGHRRIAHLAGPLHLSTGRTRAQAFADAVRQHHLTARAGDVIECDAYSVAAGEAATRRLLASRSGATGGTADTGATDDTGITAIVAANDMIALGVLRALHDAGLSCPADMSVTGFNDMPFVDQLSPSLTTIRLPQYAVGTQAAELLLDRLADPLTIAKSILLPVALIPRGSTAPPDHGST